VTPRAPFVNTPPPPRVGRPHAFQRPVSLAEVLDRVLTKGAVVSGEVVISVAGIELVYLGLNLVLTSVDTARQSKAHHWATLDGRPIATELIDDPR
jgi:gas vesicle structural protein